MMQDSQYDFRKLIFALNTMNTSLVSVCLISGNKIVTINHGFEELHVRNERKEIILQTSYAFSSQSNSTDFRPLSNVWICN